MGDDGWDDLVEFIGVGDNFLTLSRNPREKVLAEAKSGSREDCLAFRICRVASSCRVLFYNCFLKPEQPFTFLE